MICGIYAIVNNENGKKYVGSAENIFSRWAGHLRALNEGKHINSHLQNAFNKYGLEGFTFFILEECDPEDLLDREQMYLPKEMTLEALKAKGYYNNSPMASGTRGIKWSEKSRKKISEDRTGVTTYVRTEAQNKARSEYMKGNQRSLGVKPSEETKLKRFKSMMGRPGYAKGSKRTPEQIEKYRRARAIVNEQKKAGTYVESVQTRQRRIRAERVKQGIHLED